VDKLAQSVGKLDKLTKGMQSVGKSMMGAGAVMGVGVGATLKAFADLEQAQVELRNAFADPSSLKYFEEINRQAIKAGDLYPGTSADFLNLAASMKMAGADAASMAAGGFKAASALQVMFKMAPGEAGAFFQEMSNAMGIAGKDAEAFADQIQRVRYASGLSASGIHDALKYAAAPMKSLGIQGMGQSSLVLATMGSLKKGGLADEQVGTAMAQFLDRLAIARARLAAGDTRGAAMKAAFGELDKSGVKLDFFDAKGGFLGLANALGQITQVGKMNDAARSLVGKGLFGAQGARVLTAANMDQVNTMLARMREQESLQTRLDRITNTLGNRWESLKGTAVNALAAIGEKMAPVLTPLLDKLNGIVGNIRDWIDRNPKMAATIGLAAGALASFLVAGGGTLWVVGKLIGMFATIQPLLAGFAAKSMLAAWPVALLALGGLLVYKHWDVVGPMFKDIGTNLGIVFDAMGDVFGALRPLGGELDKFNEKLSATQTIAILLAKAIGAIAYGLTVIVAVQKAAFAGVRAYLPGNGLYTGTMKDAKQGWESGGLVGGAWGAISGAWQRTTGKAWDVGMTTMEGAKDPLGLFGPTARAAASAPAPVNVGGIQIQVDGSKDPKATADEIDRMMREKAAEYGFMFQGRMAAANRGAY
jgi:TP901 family phage tail tape measure protein